MNPSSRSRNGSISWDDEKLSRLVRTIEGEIVPRLVILKATNPTPSTAYAPAKGEVEQFVQLLLTHDVNVASSFVQGERERGASLDAICLNLLAPAARHLGLLWEQDECDFVQVTVGLCRLHQLLRELSPEFKPQDAGRPPDRRILLVGFPGEQHTFGVALVAQYLRRAGWDVWHESPASVAEILEIVSTHWIAILGLSVGNDVCLAELGDSIQSIRQVSRNRAIGVMIGGPIFVADPGLAVRIGADSTAIDGAQAVLRAEQICTALSSAN